MAHTRTHQDQLLARVRRIAGQIAAVERAIVDEAGCSNILHQVAGVRGAVLGLMDELIEEHMREHVVRADLPQDERAQGAEELLSAMKRYAK